MTIKVINDTVFQIPQTWDDISFQTYINLHKWKQQLPDNTLEINQALQLFELICKPSQDLLDDISIEMIADITKELMFLYNDPIDTRTEFTIDRQLYTYPLEVGDLKASEVMAVNNLTVKEYPKDMPDILAIIVREVNPTTGKRIIYKQQDTQRRKELFLNMPFSNAIGPITFYLTILVPLITQMNNPVNEPTIPTKVN